MDWYKCYTVWIWETRTTCICDTISWFPTKVAMPTMSADERILTNLDDIHQALTQHHNVAPISTITPSVKEQLQQLDSILRHSPVDKPTEHTVKFQSPLHSTVCINTTEPAAPINASHGTTTISTSTTSINPSPLPPPIIELTYATNSNSNDASTLRVEDDNTSDANAPSLRVAATPINDDNASSLRVSTATDPPSTTYIPPMNTAIASLPETVPSVPPPATVTYARQTSVAHK
jgi:hypothetical protein